MKTFKIYWVSGRVEFLIGVDILTALADTGHPKSAIRAIKRYEEVLMKKKVDTQRSITSDHSSFREYLVEHVTGKDEHTSNQHSKNKRAQRRERKALDKAY